MTICWVHNNLNDSAQPDTTKVDFLSHQEEKLEGTYVLWNEYLDYYYLMCKK